MKGAGLIKKILPPALFVIFVFALDQITKNIAVARLTPLPGHRSALIDGVFSFMLTSNSGAAWSLFSGSRIFLLLVSAAAFALIYYMFRASWLETPAEKWAMYAVIGGALGNLYDRLFRAGGLVVDFFYFELINFPIFNVADIFITAGGGLFIIVFLLRSLRAHKKEKQEEKNDPSES